VVLEETFGCSGVLDSMENILEEFQFSGVQIQRIEKACPEAEENLERCIQSEKEKFTPTTAPSD